MSNIAKGVWIYNLDGTLFGQFRTQKDALEAMGIRHKMPMIHKTTMREKWVVSFSEEFPGVRRKGSTGLYYGMVDAMRRHIALLASPKTIREIRGGFPTELTPRKAYETISALFLRGEIGRVRLSKKYNDYAYGPLDVVKAWNEPPRNNVALFDTKHGVFVTFPTMKDAADSIGVTYECFRQSKMANRLIKGRYVHDPENLPRSLRRKRDETKPRVVKVAPKHTKNEYTYETMVFKSIEEASEATGLSEYVIRNSSRTGCFFRWKYKAIIHPDRVEVVTKEKIGGGRKPSAREIRTTTNA